MKVTIYRKSSGSNGLAETYDMAQPEFERLAKDSESFLKEGTPRKGIYRYNTGEVKEGIRCTQELILQFDEISVIGFG